MIQISDLNPPNWAAVRHLTKQKLQDPPWSKTGQHLSIQYLRTNRKNLMLQPKTAKRTSKHGCMQSDMPCWECSFYYLRLTRCNGLNTQSSHISSQNIIKSAMQRLIGSRWFICSCTCYWYSQGGGFSFEYFNSVSGKMIHKSILITYQWYEVVSRNVTVRNKNSVLEIDWLKQFHK